MRKILISILTLVIAPICVAVISHFIVDEPTPPVIIYQASPPANEASFCNGYRYFIGTEAQDWRVKWDFDMETHYAKLYQNGNYIGKKEATIKFSCSERKFSLEQSNANDSVNCTYFGSIADTYVVGKYTCSNNIKTYVFSGTLTQDGNL